MQKNKTCPFTLHEKRWSLCIRWHKIELQHATLSKELSSAHLRNQGLHIHSHYTAVQLLLDQK